MTQRYAKSKGYTALAVAITLLALVPAALAGYEFDVYRLVGFEKDGRPSGSRISSFNLVGSHHSGDLLRKLALIHFSEINTENIENLLSKKLSGVLIILPTERLEVNEAQVWRVIEENFVNKHTQIPVYFCDENDVVLQFYEKSRAAVNKEKPNRHINHDIDSSMTFIVNGADPKLSRISVLEDFYGVLDESTSANKISLTSNPVILLVASYDSVTFAPEARLGLNDFSSGAIALLNIAKQLSDFYENNKEINYNILFVLTSSRSFNYEGLETWLQKAENSRIVNKVEFAIFLDSLAERDNLNLQLINVDQSNNEPLNNVLKTLQQISKTYDTPVQLVQTHSQFLNRKFPVLRISDRVADLENAPAEWINSLNYNYEAFKKNIALVTELLASSIYGLNKNFRVVDSAHLNEGYLRSTINLFETRSTFPTQITRDSVLAQELFRAFSDVVKHPFKNSFTYANPQFYTPTKSKVRLTRINSAFFDFYLFLGNIAWLSVLYFVLTQTNTSDDTKRAKQSAATTDAKAPKSPRLKKE